MSDDHEYVPFHGILSTWPGDWRERAEKAEAELRNMTEAVRQVNQRLVQVTAERDAALARAEKAEYLTAWALAEES